MNPGVQATIFTIVFMILVITGWGDRTLRDARWKPRTLFLLLALLLVAAPWTLPGPFGLRWNLAGVLLPVLLIVRLLQRVNNWSSRLQYILALMTVASTVVVLMTLVPLDPAFFPLEGKYLYPLAAMLVSVASIRRPFIALTIAVGGLALGAWIDPFIHDRVDVQAIVLGADDVRDLMAYTALGVLLVHGPYHALAQYVIGLFRQVFNRQQEGGPEHV